MYTVQCTPIRGMYTTTMQRDKASKKKRLLYTIYIVHIIYSTVESCKNSIVQLMIPEDVGVQISPVSKQQNSKYYYYYC